MELTGTLSFHVLFRCPIWLILSLDIGACKKLNYTNAQLHKLLISIVNADGNWHVWPAALVNPHLHTNRPRNGLPTESI